MYNVSVMKHFLCPKNAGTLQKANAVGQSISTEKGEIVKFYLKIDPDTHIIQDARFKTMGCPAAIACSDIACEIVKGKTIEEASQISNAEIIAYLGELPMDKIVCATTVEEAIQATLAKFQKRQNKLKAKQE